MTRSGMKKGLLTAQFGQAGDSEDSDDGGPADAQNATSASRWLRKACVKHPYRDLPEIAAFLAGLDADVAAAAVNQGNRNGKAPLHFVSQIRGGTDEGPRLLDLLC